MQFWRHWVHLVIMAVASKTDSFIYNLTAGKSALKPHICNYLIYDKDVNRTTILKITAQSHRALEIRCEIVILNYTFLTLGSMKHHEQKTLTFRTPVSLSFLSCFFIYSPSNKSLKLNLAKQRPSLTKMIIYQNPTRGTGTAKRENSARKGWELNWLRWQAFWKFLSGWTAIGSIYPPLPCFSRVCWEFFLSSCNSH